MLTINDIPIPISQELESFAYSVMDPDDAWPLEPPAWPSPSSHLGQFQFAPRWAPARRMKINRIVWPMWGMSRWAYGCFLMHASQIDELRSSAIDQKTKAINPIKITMKGDNVGSVDSGGYAVVDARNSHSIVFDKMYMLPPRIVARKEPSRDFANSERTSNGLYLLPVVDERYFFNDPRVQHNTEWNECLTTWEDVVKEITEDVMEATSDKIAGFSGDEYEGETGYAVSKPHPDLQHRMATRGMYFDAVACAIGMRWVAFPKVGYQQIDSIPDKGEYSRYHLMSWATSLEIRKTRRTENASITSQVVRSAGGELFPEIA